MNAMWPVGATAVGPTMRTTSARDDIERDARRFEDLRGDAVALGEQAEQQVLGADVVVRQAAGLLLRQHHHRAGLIGEAFEHALIIMTLSIPCSYHGLLIGCVR